MVHADRLKTYKSPTKHSIRAEDDDTEDIAEEITEKRTTQPTRVSKKAKIAAKDLVDKLHAFLDPEETDVTAKIDDAP